MSNILSQLSPEDLAELKNSLKSQVLDEIKDERTKTMELAKQARIEQKAKYEAYVAEMKESTEPWVDVTGWSETDEGVKVELEWNDSFVDYLKGNGVNGTDDDTIVQKWVTLLLRDMADQMDNKDTDGEFE